MRELNLILESAPDIGGGAALAGLTPAERAVAAKERVMAVYRGGVLPSIDNFIAKRPDGHSCACVIGTLALGLESKIMADKQRSMAASDADRDVRGALVNQVCDATQGLAIGEVLALEEGFMEWKHGYYSNRHAKLSETIAFFKAGQDIRKEAFGRV